jgi:hypothetical protein
MLRSGVTDPGAGDITTREPVHLDLRATTSAKSDRSANATFGCDLNCRQASSVGIDVSVRGKFEDEMIGAIPQDPHFVMSPQQPPTTILSDWFVRMGQSMHGDVELIECPIAWQNALPKASSEHAMQLEGSPEHLADDDRTEIGVTENTEFVLWPSVRRRIGTGAWYAGRFSRMFNCEDVGAPSWEGWSIGGMLIGWSCSDLSEMRLKSVSAAACCMAISLQTQGMSGVHSTHGKESSGSSTSIAGTGSVDEG